MTNQEIRDQWIREDLAEDRFSVGLFVFASCVFVWHLLTYTYPVPPSQAPAPVTAPAPKTTVGSDHKPIGLLDVLAYLFPLEDP